MSKTLNKIGQNAKKAFETKVNSKLKNKVLIDYIKLIRKNKKKNN